MEITRFRIEELTDAHNVHGFDCGDEKTNIFLKEKALREQERGYSRTYVMVDKGNENIIAFVSASACNIDLGKAGKKYLENLDYPTPGVLLARVGRDIRYEGGRYGQIMNKYCLGLAHIVSDWVGCRIVWVDAYPQKTADYSRIGFHKCKKRGKNIGMYHDLAKGRRVHPMPPKPEEV